jgi:molybdate transport system substrate-binding protein
MGWRVAVLLVLAPVAAASAQELTLSVAISMKEVVEEVGRQFGRDHPGVTLRYNLGASGELQKQIEAGAPVDVFVSAAARQMDELERQGLIVSATRRAFARNLLVVVAPGDARLAPGAPGDLLAPYVQRIAIGNPRTVPAGQYAEESLRALGLWDRVQPRLVLAENVRQVLDYVARGEVDAGFVYATEAAVRSGRVREVFRLPEDTHRAIVYPAAVVATSRQPALAAAFVELLAGRQGRAIVIRLGFQPPPTAAR